MSAIHRWNRGVQLDRTGELSGGLSPVRDLQAELPPVEPLARLQQHRFEDAFDSADSRFKAGIDAAGKRSPAQLSAIDKLLTSTEFQQRLQETLEGTSTRAQQAKQVESTYKSFWKDSQDFSVRKGPSLSVPEPPPRFEAPAETAWKGRGMTLPEFKASVDDVPESARVQQAPQATAAVLEARRASAVAEQPFKLLGYAALRG